jgi:hypothetical protein
MATPCKAVYAVATGRDASIGSTGYERGRAPWTVGSIAKSRRICWKAYVNSISGILNALRYQKCVIIDNI